MMRPVWFTQRRVGLIAATCLAMGMALGVSTLACAQKAPQAHQQPASSKLTLPIAYEFNDPNPWVKNSVYTVYQTDKDTVVLRHPNGEPPKFDHFDPSRTSAWYAGKASGQKIARVLEVHRPVLVRPAVGDYKPGMRERRHGRNGVSFVAYDGLHTELVRGDAERTIAGHKTHAYLLKIRFQGTRFDKSGKKLGQKNYAYAHRLWIAEDLPYSPAFALPFRVIGRLFVEDDDTRLGEYILNQVRDDIRQKGLVLGVEFRREGAKKPLYQMQASALRRPKTKLAEMPSYPVIDDDMFSKIAPVTILSHMLEPTDKKAAAASHFELSYSGDAKGKVRGTAVYGTNEHGDFALLLRVPLPAHGKKQPRRQVFLLLMRPMHGNPAKGDYQVSNAVDDLDSLPDEKLEELSQLFTVMGIVRAKSRHAKYPNVFALLDVKKGAVTISSDEDGLTGKLELKLDGVELSDKVSHATLTFTGTFHATEALENVGFEQDYPGFEPLTPTTIESRLGQTASRLSSGSSASLCQDRENAPIHHPSSRHRPHPRCAGRMRPQYVGLEQRPPADARRRAPPARACLGERAGQGRRAGRRAPPAHRLLEGPRHEGRAHPQADASPVEEAAHARAVQDHAPERHRAGIFG